MIATKTRLNRRLQCKLLLRHRSLRKLSIGPEFGGCRISHFKISVAVGTPVSRRPPHGSVREELPHTALTLG